MRNVMRMALAAAVLATTVVIAPVSVARDAPTIGAIEVVNRTRYRLDQVYISPCGTVSTQNALPPRTIIRERESYIFDIAPGCYEVDSGRTNITGAKVRVNVVAGQTTRIQLST